MISETMDKAEQAQDEKAQILQILDARAHQYGLLSRMFLKEIDIDTMRELQGMRFPQATGNELVDRGYRQLYEYLRKAWDDSVTELAVDFVRTFIGHGVNGYSAAYPFESVYTSERRLLMQEARAEVLEVLRANGMKRGAWTEGEDHVALEMEFMQRKAIEAHDSYSKGDEGAATDALEVSRRFLNDHILNWLPMLASDMLQFAKTEFYQGLANLALGYAQTDSELLDELLSES